MYVQWGAAIKEPTSRIALASLAVVLPDAAFLTRPSFAVVLADARPAAWLAPTPYAAVLADAWPAA